MVWCSLSRHSRLAAPLLVLAAGALAVVMILALQSRADQSRRAQAQLGTVGAQFSQRSYAPVGAMFGAPGALVRLQMAALKQRIEVTVDRLARQAPVPELADLRRALPRVFASDQGNFALISQLATARGRALLAGQIARRDASLMRPLLTSKANSSRMARALDRATAAYGRRATRAQLQARLGTLAAIALLVLAFWLVYRRSVRARAVAERLAAQNASMAASHRREAVTDALTGLGNRRALVDALDHALARADEAPVALALFDLDGFKSYNDTFGHQAGDALLRRLGGRLAERLDGVADAFRMGGDEFCVLAQLDGEDAVSIARRAADALSETGDGFAVGCSFGLAFAPAEAGSAAELLRIADQRMYAQKTDNRHAAAAQQSTDVLLQVLSEQDSDLAAHAGGVGRLAAATAARLGMSAPEANRVALAAELHDIGKSAIPDSILAKPGPLDEGEWQFIRRHTIIGARIVGAAPALSHTAPLIRASHERVDGTGYPDRLAGDRIPLGARIIAVCDAFDAMIASRPYASARSVPEALEEIRRGAGSQFDPRVVEAFCALAEHDASVAAALR